MGSRESTKSQDHNGLHDLEDVEEISELNQGTEDQEAAMGSWGVLVGEKDLEQTEVRGEDVIFPKKEHVDCKEIADGSLMVNIDQAKIKKEEEKKSVTNSKGKAVDCYEEDIETEKGILIAGRKRSDNEDFEVELCKDFEQKLHEYYFPAGGIGSLQKEGNTEKTNENEVSVEEIIKRFKKQEVEEKAKTNQFRKGLYQKESTSLIGNGGNDSIKEFYRSISYEERRFIESRVAQLKLEVSLLEKKISRRTVPNKIMDMEMQDYIKFLMECCRQSIKRIIELLKNDCRIEQIERQIRHLEEQVEDLRSTIDS